MLSTLKATAHYAKVRTLSFLALSILWGSLLLGVLWWSVTTATVWAFDPLTASSTQSNNILLSTNCADVTEIPQSECNALVMFYAATNGAQWTKSDNWLTDNFPCSWYGVSCSGGHVHVLELPDNNLSGTLPTQLGDLINLKYFILPQNRLHGEIPSQVGQWKLLITFDLDDNQLGGSIPESLGTLPQLKWLGLANNQLTGTIPVSLSKLTNLINLVLPGNRLTGTIPASLGTLTNLQKLYLGANRLSGEIPPELGNLQQLTVLHLANNLLVGNIPVQLGNLTNLTTLALESNQLTGNIPSTLSNLKKLELLGLGSNKLVGTMPTWISTFQAMKQLDLADNQFYGSIPYEYGLLGDLTYLALDENHLTGTIPLSLLSLTKLEQLFLDQNELSGPIPAGLGNLSELQVLFLAGNQLTGNIPPELSKLSKLVSLNLAVNQLTGAIPAALGSLQALQVLDLGYNRLNGPLPVELLQLSKLEQLDLSKWQGDGTLPLTWLKTLTKLRFLALEGSGLTDLLPSELGDLRQLEHLDLAHNELHGSISQSFISLTNLSHLDLSYNNLTGAVPVGLKELPKLKYLNLQGNKLEPGPSLPPTLPTLILIYAVLDNNLSSEWTRLINNIELGIHSNVIVRLLIDGSGKNDSYIYDLKHDTNLACPNTLRMDCGYVDESTRFRASEDSASFATLSNFIISSLDQYSQTQHVILTLIGHGSGWSADALPAQPSFYKEQRFGGLLWDDNANETTASNALSTQELGSALANVFATTRRKIDLLYFDACSMAMTEVAYEVRTGTRYMLATPSTDWADFVYDRLIASVAPTQSASMIGEQWLRIEAAYLRSFPGHPFAFSLIDLDKMNAVATATSALADAMRFALPTQREKIRTVALTADTNESNYDGSLTFTDTNKDLSDLVFQLETFSGDATIQQAAQRVSVTLQSAVVLADYQNGIPWLYPASNWTWRNPGGLSIYLPLQNDEARRKLFYNQSYLAWAQDTTWDEFLTAYWSVSNAAMEVVHTMPISESLPTCIVTTDPSCANLLPKPLPMLTTSLPTIYVLHLPIVSR